VIVGAVLVLLSAVLIIRAPDSVNAYALHDPIHIDSEEGFNAANGVTGGNGTTSDPYLIEGWQIGPSGGIAIWIENTESHFVVRDMTISGNKVELAYCSNGSVLGCDISTTTSDAISLWSCDNIEISGCNLSAGEYGGAGVRVNRGQGITVNECDMVDCYWGVLVYEGASYVNLTGNHISRCTYYGGICVYNSDHVALSGNILASAGIGFGGRTLDDYQTLSIDVSNLVEGRPFYLYKNLDGITIDRVPIGGLLIANCSHVRASNLSLWSVYDGISMAYSEDIAIENCTFASVGDDGIVLASCSKARVFRNYLASVQVYGVHVDSCNDIDLVYNTVTSNSTETSHMGQGIHVAHSSDVSLDANRVVDGWTGIEVWDCSRIDVWHNAMLDIGFEGICLSSASEVRITENLISSCGEEGLLLRLSSQVTVTGNNFLDNAVQVLLDNSDLIEWNDTYPDGGNYWSDYSGTDSAGGAFQNVTGLDGIGDAPYVIDASNSDQYPLMVSRIPNLAPIASLTIVPVLGDVSAVFMANASASWDFEDWNGSLLVRWDWEGDGVWDTVWTPNRTAQHVYSSEGNFSLRLEVMDSEGMTDNSTASVTVLQSNRDGLSDDYTWGLLIIVVVSAVVILAVAIAMMRKRKVVPPPA